MKIVLLVMLAFICDTAKSQDNNFFDLQKHLQKKNITLIKTNLNNSLKEFWNDIGLRLQPGGIKCGWGSNYLEEKSGDPGKILNFLEDLNQYSTTIALNNMGYYKKMIIPKAGNIPNAAIPFKVRFER